MISKEEFKELGNRFFMKPTNEKIVKKKLWGFDIETYGKYNKFLMGSFVNETEKFVFWNKEELLDFFFNSHKLRGAYVFATNLGFDFMGTFNKDLEKFDYMIRGTDFISIKYKNSVGSKITLMDTMSFLKLGVANIGKIIGLKKGEKPKCLGEIPKNSDEAEELEKYNIQDSYISFKFAEFLQESFNSVGANMKYTIASTSKSLFTNKYLKTFILQPEKSMIRKQFKAYYGGRTEAFYRGSLPDKTYIYDINSLYPHVMNKYKFPNPNTLVHLKTNSDLKYIEKYEGVSLCKIKTPSDLDIPLLPMRTKDKLVFPLGIFQNWQTHAELRKAIELGYEIEPIETVYFKKTFNPFKDFTNDLYKKRNELKAKGSNLEICYKLLLNSLYGKFAQKLETKELYFKDNLEHKEKIKTAMRENKFRMLNDEEPRYKIEGIDEKIIKVFDEDNTSLVDFSLFHVTDLDSEKYPKFINPILSLYITSYARLELYKHIERVKKKGGIVYYVDTDSLFTDTKLKTSNKLGDLKLEYTARKGIIIKPKFYYLKIHETGRGYGENKDEVFKIKGLMNIKSYEDFYNILATRKHSYTKFVKFKESYRRRLKFNQKLEVSKIINLEDNKRLWQREKIKIKKLEKSKPLIICYV